MLGMLGCYPHKLQQKRKMEKCFWKRDLGTCLRLNEQTRKYSRETYEVLKTELHWIGPWKAETAQMKPGLGFLNFHSQEVDQEIYCCRLCVCIFPKVVCWSLSPSKMVFGGRTFASYLGHEGEGRMIIKETPDSFLGPFAMGRHSKKTDICEAGSGLHQTRNLPVP